MKKVEPLRVLTTITAVTMVTAVAAFSGSLLLQSRDLLTVGLIAGLIAIHTGQRCIVRLQADKFEWMSDRYGRIVWFWKTDIDALKHGTARPDPTLLDVPEPREPEPKSTVVP